MDSMDFHKLSRRQLQTLCKKNTIPANMTNIAMADALTARTNVIGIEEIGQIDSAMPETPLTSRKTTVRRTATKPAVEPESTQTLTRPRRATAKKINKEEDPKESSENTSANETPVPRPGRKRVTSTSVCRKLDAQTQEVKEENKEERPVVHAYSTRRSSRLQSDKKISESVQKLGGRRTEAVKIAALSEEETDDVHMKSSSDATVEVQENKGDNVMVLDAIPDSTQEDLISEDGSSTVVSADVSSSIGEVSSANQDLISESKDEFSVEQSSDLQDMSNEVSSIISDAHVSEIFVSERTLISESKDEITFDDGAHADQDMSFEVSNIASDDLHNMEIKEEPAVEVTVISPNVSGQKTALADQDMSFENSYVASDDLSNMEIKEEPAVEVTVISPNASGQRTTHADQHMSFEDSNVASDDLSNMEIKEEAAVEVTVISPNVSSQKTAQVLEASPVEKKTHDLEKPKLDCLMGSPTSDQVDDVRNEDEMVESNESYEVEKTDDSELKFSFEDDLCDTQFEVQKSPLKSEVFDFGNMKETMDYISDLERCNQVAAPLVSDVIELENEKLDGDEMQVTADLPVLSLTNATVPSPSVEALECTQFKLDDSVSVEQLENKLVDSEKCDSIADDKDVKADSLLVDVSTDDEGSDNESDASKESDYTDESDDDDETVDNDESDDNDEIHDTPVAGLVKSQNPVTPLKSSSAKKTATPNSRMMIKVLEDTDEDNKSGKISLKSNSKLLTSGVAEEKENSDNNKGESTAQKSLKKKSLRQLKKMLSEMTITDNKKTMGNENLQVEKRSALQMLNDNCLVGEEDK